MVSKGELQTTLKDQYGISKNITQSLSSEDCENLLNLLSTQPSVDNLVKSFLSKNSELAKNNRFYGQQRHHAEKKLAKLQADHQQLEKSISKLEVDNGQLEVLKKRLFEEHEKLEIEVNDLSSQNQSLSSNVQSLTTLNDELVEANNKLKKDNKELKNVVDQIRLRLARDTKMLLQYEDSEIRKAMIRLFRWTLG